MCLPSDGPAPALVTYERRPLRSVIGSPAAVRIGSPPIMYRLTPDFDMWSSTVSVHITAAGTSSRWRMWASLPTNSWSLALPHAIPASTTL